ncbi:GNAT family N-acetyltransferase, partial [Pseudoroseomonas ludipueritiae]
AGGVALRWQERMAPRLGLEPIRAAGGDWLAGRSGNSRYQIRRSNRAYGALRLHRADGAEQALAFLEALIRLHEATWRARGKPGAFATPFLRCFHEALIRRAAPRGELDMLRIEADGKDVGYLYNFRMRGHVHAYQSGLDHAGAGPHQKPGLTCHALAIEHALARGDSVYDFLAGADRYKRSLASAELPLIWAEMVPRWSALGVAARLRGLLRRS